MAAPVNKFSYNVRKYVVEARDSATGELLFRTPEPPFREATEEQLIQHYFRHCPEGASCSQEAICAWYAKQGWFFRPKTW